LNIHSASVKTDNSITLLRDDFVLVTEPTHPDARVLLAYWRQRMEAGSFIMGEDVPARPIARLLRNLAVHEPLADCTDMRTRLAGDGIRRRFDGEIKGRCLSELFPPKDFEHHRDTAYEVLRTGTPVIIESRMMRETVLELHLEAVLLPMTAPDLVSRWLLAGLFYFN
jgi:hypothetical protein